MRLNVRTSNTMTNIQAAAQEVTNDVRLAANRALSRSVVRARVVVVKEIRQNYTINPRFLKSGIKVDVNKSNLTGYVNLWGCANPLDRFKMSPRKDTTGNRRKPLKVAVKKGGLKRLGGNTFSWAHGGKREGAGFLIMKRLGDTRLPIERLYGPATPHMADNPEIIENVTREMSAAYNKTFEHEIKRRGHGR